LNKYSGETTQRNHVNTSVTGKCQHAMKVQKSLESLPQKALIQNMHQCLTSRQRLSF